MMSLDEVSPAARTSSVDVLALDQALDTLSSFDVQQCRVVELRFFGGLNIDEAAEALGVSTATVEREWAMAKAFRKTRVAATVRSNFTSSSSPAQANSVASLPADKVPPFASQR